LEAAATRRGERRTWHPRQTVRRTAGLAVAATIWRVGGSRLQIPGDPLRDRGTRRGEAGNRPRRNRRAQAPRSARPQEASRSTKKIR